MMASVIATFTDCDQAKEISPYLTLEDVLRCYPLIKYQRVNSNTVVVESTISERCYHVFNQYLLVHKYYPSHLDIIKFNASLDCLLEFIGFLAHDMRQHPNLIIEVMKSGFFPLDDPTWIRVDPSWFTLCNVTTDNTATSFYMQPFDWNARENEGSRQVLVEWLGQMAMRHPDVPQKFRALIDQITLISPPQLPGHTILNYSDVTYNDGLVRLHDISNLRLKLVEIRMPMPLTKSKQEEEFVVRKFIEWLENFSSLQTIHFTSFNDCISNKILHELMNSCCSLNCITCPDHIPWTFEQFGDKSPQPLNLSQDGICRVVPEDLNDLSYSIHGIAELVRTGRHSMCIKHFTINMKEYKKKFWTPGNSTTIHFNQIISPV